jgi:copper resistance protein C
MNFRLTTVINRILIYCIVSASLFAAGETFAHAKLVKSDPGRRAVIKTPPKEIRLWFNEKLEPAYSSASLSGADGKLIATKPASLSGDDAKYMILAVEPLPPGIYRVKFRVLSVDGHVVDSSFTFTLLPAK